VTCKVNEKSIFSDKEVLKKLANLEVQPVVIDMTGRDTDMVKDLSRVDRETLPVNLVYPSNYSANKDGYPAIILEGTVLPGQALEALKIVEQWSKEG